MTIEAEFMFNMSFLFLGMMLGVTFCSSERKRNYRGVSTAPKKPTPVYTVGTRALGRIKRV